MSKWRNLSFKKISQPVNIMILVLPWSSIQQHAFNKLKCFCVKLLWSLYVVVDFTKPFEIYADELAVTVSSMSPFSRNLRDTQKAWGTIRHEVYASVTAIHKCCNCFSVLI